MSNGSKKCSKCGQTKSLEEFYRCSRVKDGRQAACKECKKAQRNLPNDRKAARRRYQENLESARRANREARRRQRKKDPEGERRKKRAYRENNIDRVRERERLQHQSWRRANLAREQEKERERDRAWRDNNRELARKRHRAWRARNRDVVRAAARQIAHRRRARLRAGAIYRVISKDERRLEFACCIACGRPADTTDHLMPVSRGGAHGVGNLAPMCRSCNSSKGAKTITEWRKANNWLPLGRFPQRKDRADGAA